MTERLSDVEQRIESIEQLSSIVSAYRGIAAARLRDAQQRLEGIRSYAATVAEAIGQALALLSGKGQAAPQQPTAGTRLVIALCSEQGFVANFNTRILEETKSLIDSSADSACELFVIGDRGLSLAEERGLTADWSAPMAAHADEVTSLGGRLAEALYQRIETDCVSRATIVHGVPGQSELEVVAKPLIPFDFDRFPMVAHPVQPLITLPIEELAARLAEEYVFAELCEAVMLSYAAENEMRMKAMLAARDNVSKQLDELTAKARCMRQEEITAEVIELAAGVEAGTGPAS